MIKLFLLFLTIFFNPFKENDYKVYEDDYIDLNIIKESSEYSLSFNNKYIFSNGKNSIVFENNDIKIDFCEFQNKVLLLLLEEENLQFFIYDNELNLITSGDIIRRGTLEFDFFIHDGKLIIYGTVNNECDLTGENKKLGGNDTFICTYDGTNFNIKFFGGTTDEWFKMGVSIDEYMYFYGYKNPLGEGDFGNGGRNSESLFLTKINANLEVIETKILDCGGIINSIYNYDNYIYLIGERNVFYINKATWEIEKDCFDEEILFTNMSDNILSLFLKNRVYIKDVSNYKYGFVSIDGEIININNGIVVLKDGKYKKVDIALLYNYRNKTNYIDEEASLYTLFGKCKQKENEFLPRLDKQVYGEYKCYQNYETVGGIEIEYISNYEIEKEANVKNGGIYPVGYRILFSGKGYLNGNKVLNNYQITSSGDYILELFSNIGESYEIKFKVSSLQIDFIEKINKSDMEILLGEKASIKFKVNFTEDVDFECVQIDGENRYDIYYEENSKMIYIPLNEMLETGKHIYNIERVYYKINDTLYFLDINEKYSINVLQKNLDSSVSEIAKEKIVFLCNDINLCARYFKIIARTNNDEKVYSFPICSQNIVLENLSENRDYIVDVYLVSNNGGENDVDTLLFSLFMMDVNNNINLGKISLLKYQNSLEKFSFEFDKDILKNELRNISINEKKVFENQMFEEKKYYLLLFITFSISFALTLVFKKAKIVK